MTKFRALTLALLLLGGCAWAKTALRTTMDIARCLCEVAAAEQPSTELAGMTPEEWCAIREHAQPFFDKVLEAKAAAKKEAFSREPK